MMAVTNQVPRPKVLLGLTGSVASIKVPELVAQLSAFAEVKVVATASALIFMKDWRIPEAVQPVLGDEAEWHAWKQVGDEVLHIELRRWADVLIIAPLSANTLAKISHGQCDNLLTCVVRAWDWHRPLLVAPAMNTYMWDSPFTSQQLAVLVGLGARIIPPVSKTLACGDTGLGAMASPAVIAAAVLAAVTASPVAAPASDIADNSSAAAAAAYS